MDRGDVVVAHCTRCPLSIVSTGGIGALIAAGWVKVEGAEPPQQGSLPMICPNCMEEERQRAKRAGFHKT